MRSVQQHSDFNSKQFILNSKIRMSFYFFSANFVLNVLIVVTHSTTISTPFIFGGEKATENKLPYLVSLRLKIGDYYKHVCGGTILSDCVVITAAHCIEPDLEVTEYGISVGAHTKDENGHLYSIKKFIVHPNNAFIGANDIALIILEKSIDFNENSNAIQINRNFIDGNGKVVTAGWGANEVSHLEPYLQKLSKINTEYFENFCRINITVYNINNNHKWRMSQTVSNSGF